MQILFLDKDALSSGLSFENLYKLGTVTEGGSIRCEEDFLALAEKYPNIEILLVNKAPVTRKVLYAFPCLQYVGVFATGYNNVDLQAASERNIVVTNIPKYSTDAVAQLTFSFILKDASYTDSYIQKVKEGAWSSSDAFSLILYPQRELAHKTLGILGYGSIGKKVGEIGKAFGMNVLYSTRTVPSDPHGYEFVSAEELLKRSDYLSLHCPLNEDTAHFICREHLLKMKKNAVLINTARGGLVKEDDLFEALNSHRIRAAYLDVLEKEPMEKSCPLSSLDNCFITPHVGWVPLEARMRLLEIASANIQAFLSGKPVNQVNN